MFEKKSRKKKKHKEAGEKKKKKNVDSQNTIPHISMRRHMTNLAMVHAPSVQPRESAESAHAAVIVDVILISAL